MIFAQSGEINFAIGKASSATLETEFRAERIIFAADLRCPSVFTLHGVNQQERVVLRRELRRHQLEAFFAKQPATEVVLEACGGSHHWGRVLTALGHRVRLIPPQ